MSSLESIGVPSSHWEFSLIQTPFEQIFTELVGETNVY